MKHAGLVQVLVVLALVVTGSAAFAEEPFAVGAQLGAPFVLTEGETGLVVPDGLQVTLRSASDDSGCLAPDDCSVAVFMGTILVRLGEKKELSTVYASLKQDDTASLDFAGYEIRFGQVRRLDKGDIQATFTVTKAEEAEEEEEEED